MSVRVRQRLPNRGPRHARFLRAGVEQFGDVVQRIERLTLEDDSAAWKAVLSMLSEEFVERYRAERRKKESWFLRIAHAPTGYGPIRAAGLSQAALLWQSIQRRGRMVGRSS